MAITIVGDIHGKIKQMYELLAKLPIQPEVVFQLGDFQALRDATDLRYLNVPMEHSSIGEFPEFYAQGKVPVPTYFIGGNHENNHWFSQFPNGTELIKNLFYLGRSGVKDFNGIKVAWLSGNYSPVDFLHQKRKPKYQHFTNSDIEEILRQSQEADVLLMHDWPSIRAMQTEDAIRQTSDPNILAEAIKRNSGSQPAYDLLKQLKPDYALAGHVHIPFQVELEIDGKKVNFISLGKVGYEKSIGTYNLQKKQFTYN